MGTVLLDFLSTSFVARCDLREGRGERGYICASAAVSTNILHRKI